MGQSTSNLVSPLPETREYCETPFRGHAVKTRPEDLEDFMARARTMLELLRLSEGESWNYRICSAYVNGKSQKVEEMYQEFCLGCDRAVVSKNEVKIAECAHKRARLEAWIEAIAPSVTIIKH